MPELSNDSFAYASDMLNRFLMLLVLCGAGSILLPFTTSLSSASFDDPYDVIFCVMFYVLNLTVLGLIIYLVGDTLMTMNTFYSSQAMVQ